jgi:hypothetical protein
MKGENPGQGTGARDEEVIGANDHLNCIASPTRTNSPCGSAA